MGKLWKILKYITNPVGALVQDLTKNSSPDSIGDVVSHVLNPIQSVGEGISDIFTKDESSQRIRSSLEKIANDNGYSLEEFFQINPEAKRVYDEADMNGFEKLKEVYNDKYSDKVDAYIDNLTGERDVQENDKNRQFQHNEAEINRNWENEQAQIAREWDSIGAQMERAAAAGVNPISIAMQNGGINSSATTSIPSAPSTPSGSSGLMHNGLLDIASTVFSGIGTFAEQRLKQSQSDDIVIMRKYNIAEKLANIDHLKSLCKGVELSNVSQQIQNSWLDILNQASYDGMLLENGVKRETIFERRSVSKLNLKQIELIDQNMSLNLQRFNATLPLELQLMESEINSNNMSVQEKYTEICFRHLQAIEQENRNLQSASEAESAQVQANIAKATYEDAISAFHNDMVKGAAEAGISLNDYQYYGCRPNSLANMPGSTVISLDKRRQNKRGWKPIIQFNSNIKGFE